MTTLEILERARAAAPELALATTAQKDAGLLAMAAALREQAAAILEANALDLERARGTVSDVMLDRLLLTPERIEGMAAGIEEVVALPDPVGRVLAQNEPQPGLLIEKRAVPLGVVAIIYESRPNVTSDAAALCVKSGNACVLRGGKEAFNSANAIAEALRAGLRAAGLAADLVQLVQDTTRASAVELMRAKGYVDLLIPRGGAGLIRSCVENATVNCIETGTGLCHIYVDAAADLGRALAILENAKTSRPSVCNAAECCVVHEAVAAQFLPMMRARLVDERAAGGEIPVQLRACERAFALLGEGACVAATPEDFDTEFLDYTLAVKVVGSLEEAIAHIQAHSTGHSEAIVTEDEQAAERFCGSIDAAAVYVNASTRFTDGGQFGLGCEMGISTQKLHARGPMGLEEMTSYKYVIHGAGHVR